MMDPVAASPSVGNFPILHLDPQHLMESLYLEQEAPPPPSGPLVTSGDIFSFLSWDRGASALS